VNLGTKGQQANSRPPKPLRCDDNIKWILKKWNRARNGLIWLRIGTGGGLLGVKEKPIRFHKIRGIS
jgi:hypothetical protein